MSILNRNIIEEIKLHLLIENKIINSDITNRIIYFYNNNNNNNNSNTKVIMIILSYIWFINDSKLAEYFKEKLNYKNILDKKLFKYSSLNNLDISCII